MSDTPQITKIKDSDNPDEIGHYLVGTPVGMKSLRLPTETQAKRAAEVVKRMIEAEARIREMEAALRFYARHEHWMEVSEGSEARTLLIACGPSGDPNGWAEAERALSPPDSEPAEGGFRCAKCGYGSEEHGMPDHPASQCVADMRTPREGSQPKAINVVFDGPPGPTAGRFVEVETDDGKSVRAGEWIERDDGLWALRIERALAQPQESED